MWSPQIQSAQTKGDQRRGAGNVQFLACVCVCDVGVRLQPLCTAVLCFVVAAKNEPKKSAEEEEESGGGGGGGGGSQAPLLSFAS